MQMHTEQAWATVKRQEQIDMQLLMPAQPHNLRGAIAIAMVPGAKKVDVEMQSIGGKNNACQLLNALER